MAVIIQPVGKGLLLTSIFDLQGTGAQKRLPLPPHGVGPSPAPLSGQLLPDRSQGQAKDRAAAEVTSTGWGGRGAAWPAPAPACVGELLSQLITCGGQGLLAFPD